MYRHVGATMRMALSSAVGGPSPIVTLIPDAAVTGPAKFACSGDR